MIRWLPWRRRNDGFEWREYVRTTILVRRHMIAVSAVRISQRLPPLDDLDVVVEPQLSGVLQQHRL